MAGKERRTILTAADTAKHIRKPISKFPFFHSINISGDSPHTHTHQLFGHSQGQLHCFHGLDDYAIAGKEWFTMLTAVYSVNYIWKPIYQVPCWDSNKNSAKETKRGFRNCRNLSRFLKFWTSNFMKTQDAWKTFSKKMATLTRALMGVPQFHLVSDRIKEDYAFNFLHRCNALDRVLFVLCKGNKNEKHDRKCEFKIRAMFEAVMRLNDEILRSGLLEGHILLLVNSGTSCALDLFRSTTDFLSHLIFTKNIIRRYNVYDSPKIACIDGFLLNENEKEQIHDLFLLERRKIRNLLEWSQCGLELMRHLVQLICWKRDYEKILESERNIQDATDDVCSIIPVFIENQRNLQRSKSGNNKVPEVQESDEIKQPVIETFTQIEQEIKIMDPVGQISSWGSDLTLQRRALPLGKIYHVFFSYSSSDIHRVKKTVETLEKDHGFVCCEYDRDNTSGIPLLISADDSIRNAYKTVVVMTREAFKSGFVSDEIEMANTHGFDERRKCVVPVLLEDCEVPAHLSVLNFSDAWDPKMRDMFKFLNELETQDVLPIKEKISNMRSLREGNCHISYHPNTINPKQQIIYINREVPKEEVNINNSNHGIVVEEDMKAKNEKNTTIFYMEKAVSASVDGYVESKLSSTVQRFVPEQSDKIIKSADDQRGRKRPMKTIHYDIDSKIPISESEGNDEDSSFNFIDIQKRNKRQRICLLQSSANHNKNNKEDSVAEEVVANLCQINYQMDKNAEEEMGMTDVEEESRTTDDGDEEEDYLGTYMLCWEVPKEILSLKSDPEMGSTSDFCFMFTVKVACHFHDKSHTLLLQDLLKLWLEDEVTLPYTNHVTAKLPRHLIPPVFLVELPIGIFRSVILNHIPAAFEKEYTRCQLHTEHIRYSEEDEVKLLSLTTRINLQSTATAYHQRFIVLRVKEDISNYQYVSLKSEKITKNSKTDKRLTEAHFSFGSHCSNISIRAPEKLSLKYENKSTITVHTIQLEDFVHASVKAFFKASDISFDPREDGDTNEQQIQSYVDLLAQEDKRSDDFYKSNVRDIDLKEKKKSSLHHRIWLPHDQLPLPCLSRDAIVGFVEGQTRDTPPAEHEELREILTLLASDNIPGPQITMKYEMLRLCTMKSFPGGDKPFAIRIVGAGFYYAGHQDQVICYCCGNRKNNWVLEDIPLLIHQKMAPSCTFLTDNAVVSIPIRRANSTRSPAEARLLEVQRFDGANQSDTAQGESSLMIPSGERNQVNISSGTLQLLVTNKSSPPNNFMSSREQNVLDNRQTSVAIADSVQDPPPKYPQYAVKNMRINSFHGWPAELHQRPEEMAECGFYYAGFSDCVRCFYCGVGLRHWMSEDDPWIEHARWSTSCVYVYKMKGGEFVSLVKMAVEIAEREEAVRENGVANQPPQNNIKAASAGTSEEDSNSNTANNSTAPRDSTSSKKVTGGAAGGATASTPSPGNAEIQKYLLTDAAQSVLDMGYQPKMVQRAIERVLMKKGTEELTGLIIMEAVFEIEEEEKAKYKPQPSSLLAEANGTDAKANDKDKTKDKQDRKQDGDAREIEGASGEETQINVEKIRREHRELSEATLCKICLDNTISVVFLPCGHLVTCSDCAPAMRKCPICRALIKGTVKTFYG